MMNTFARTKLIFVGLFFAAAAVMWGYHFFYVWPGQRCEAMGRWWAMKERACGVPVKISTITGRPDPVPVKTPTQTPPGASNSAPAKPAPKAP